MTSAGNQNCRHLSEEGIVYGEKELSVEYNWVFPPHSFHISGMHVDPEYAPFHDLSVISANLLNQLKRYFKPNSVFIFADVRDPLVFMLRQQNQIYGHGHTFIGIWNDGTYDQFGVIRTWLRGQDYRWSDKLERALMDCYDYNLTPRESQVHHISNTPLTPCHSILSGVLSQSTGSDVDKINFPYQALSGDDAAVLANVLVVSLFRHWYPSANRPH